MARGKKNDQAKAPLCLIPYEALTETAKALGYGVKKYGKYNFKNGIEYTRLMDAAMRHIQQFKEGEDVDEETQVVHIGNAMANLSMLLYMYYNKPEMDDRYKPKKKVKK